jgi:hypothetical protein
MGMGGSVKLPEDVVIPEDKLVRYLLLPREENDKSQFLGIALPIRSIDFYYPEFQAAHVLIFRDKSEICFLESANEAIFVHKLVRKAHRSVNTIKTGVFWTKHPLRPHWAPIHITNVYSIG